ncbi:nucleotidyltransferase family protein [Colwellia sp. Arc7-635]|uniref:nucleotidyltransferase family protein n=1 Tax=Colwellia sp. Arc7-635 TaxID=2497879 RepID=UPI001F49B448|nr:nucleotidyltransferase family protein [Colwellia sp. Arc7-635]
MVHIDIIVELIESDQLRLNALACIRLLDLPECYIAAGFVRNLVWDSLHQKLEPTTLNDVDVIYFDANESSADKFIEYERKLTQLLPQLNWQVRNQALMHLKNNDEPYNSSLDAMSYWPEKETAVGIRQLSNGGFECIAAFGFDSLFKLQLTHNPKRLKSVFNHRINSKGWLAHWHNLIVVQ